MDFNARTAPEHYYLVPAGGNVYYGMFLEEDMLEYLTNVFIVRSLEIVNSDEVKKEANTAWMQGLGKPGFYRFLSRQPLIVETTIFKNCY